MTTSGAQAWDELPATDEEIAALRDPASAEEREATLSLVHWFTRRYPTYGERAAYIRRKFREAEMLRRAGVRVPPAVGR
jgi:hypothetical protein